MGTREGWRRLFTPRSWPKSPGHFSIPAYSELMPAPYIARRPYGVVIPPFFHGDDPYGWPVSEYEDHVELGPGLVHIARHAIHAMMRLAESRPTAGISRTKLAQNPYWPEELAARSASLRHERFVFLSPIALSRTQDDKGRVRWTLFGGSDRGPSHAFWRSLEPGRGVDFFRSLLGRVFGESPEATRDLAGLGLRIVAPDTALPPPLEALRLKGAGEEPIARAKYVLSFEPFSRLREDVRASYLEGRLSLLPFPGSLEPRHQPIGLS
jgi:hypothetical protein